jgi:hypothetical protein
LRKSEPALRGSDREGYTVEALDSGTIVLVRTPTSGPAIVGVFRLQGEGTVDLHAAPVIQGLVGKRWQKVLTTEDAAFSETPQPPEVDLSGTAPGLRFVGPAGVLFHAV